jgi:16S rRNA processing protein RimM
MGRVPGWLAAGRVGRPHGLDGSFHVADPRPELLSLGSVVTVGDGPNASERRIVRRAGADRRPIVKLEGCADRADVAALRGLELRVARDHAPELSDEEWWAEDVEGCAVHDGGEPVGTVTRMLALPSCEVLEVQRAAGAGQLLVPLVKDAVRTVDVERREIDVDLRFLGEG